MSSSLKQPLNNRLRAYLRRTIPSDLRLQVSKSRKLMRRVASGQQFRLAGADSAKVIFPIQMTTTQPIFETELSSNKIENLKLAASYLNDLPIAPGQILSFWHIVPRPTATNGFLEGRTLVNGDLVGEVGGGLCQLSGLIYHLSLLSGLSIVERHPHSVDLYTEETRFAPIGTDATVVFGYKDLCIENSAEHPICFRFHVTPDKIVGHVCSKGPLTAHQLITEVEINGTVKTVTITRQNSDDGRQLISIDHYNFDQCG